MPARAPDRPPDPGGRAATETAAAARARRRAEEAAAEAERQARHVARQAERADEVTDAVEQVAVRAAGDAAAAAGAAERAAAEATEAHRVADRLEQQAEDLLAATAGDDLIEGDARALVAGVDADNPFGRRGRPFSPASPVRTGFGLTLGGLLAYELLQSVLAVRQVLVLVLISAFLAVGLDPAVAWLSGRVRRSVAVGLVMLAFVGLFAGFAAAVAPPVTRQVTQLVAQAPSYIQDLQDNPRIRALDARLGLLQRLKQQAGRLPDIGVSAIGGVIGAAGAVLGALASLFTILILTLYLLSNLPQIKRLAYRLVPRTRRARVSLLGDEILARVGGYVLGNLATSLVAGLAAMVFLVVAGVPYPVALALLVAIADLIPLVGASLGAAVVALVALLGVGIAPALTAILFFTLYQQFENYVLVPRVMRRTVDVSPLATVLAALVGGSLLGIVGALLAIPVAAAAQIVLREVVLPKQDEA